MWARGMLFNATLAGQGELGDAPVVAVAALKEPAGVKQYSGDRPPGPHEGALLCRREGFLFGTQITVCPGRGFDRKTCAP